MKYLLALSLMVLTTSCDKDDCDCVKLGEIQDEWEWIRTTGWHISTPDSEGVKRSVKIDDHVFEQYENDTLVFRSEYELTYVSVATGTATLMEFTDGSFYEVRRTGLHLVLSEWCEDCDVHEYVRK